MYDPSLALAGFRIPSDILVALDNRPLHFALQPYHFLIRLLHVLSMAAFFGGIGLLDLRLMGIRATVPLRSFTEHTLPWLYAAFGVTVVTGATLFLYDPVHAGSHAYFTLKLLFILLGLLNAALFHRSGLAAALIAAAPLPSGAKVAGALSLACWLVVMITASLNVEGPPKVLLTGSANAAIVR
ncbi:MAG: hypothetical protein JWO72_1332 [Caulobacteraceae bacterium]|jgi:hypothetical protein|nr:hypothetical protein [Caulobacteraceae bacterium]